MSIFRRKYKLIEKDEYDTLNKRELKQEIKELNKRIVLSEAKLSLIEYQLRKLDEKNTNPFSVIREIQRIVYPDRY